MSCRWGSFAFALGLAAVMPAFAQQEPTGLKERLDAIVRAQQTTRKRYTLVTVFRRIRYCGPSDGLRPI